MKAHATPRFTKEAKRFFSTAMIFFMVISLGIEPAYGFTKATLSMNNTRYQSAARKNSKKQHPKLVGLAMEYLTAIQAVGDQQNPVEEDIARLITAAENFLNAAYKDASFVSSYTLFRHMGSLAENGDIPELIETQERLMVLSQFFNDADFDKYRLALASSIEKRGLYGLENVAMNVIDFELLNGKHDVVNAVKKHVGAINEFDIPAVIHDPSTDSFISLDPSYSKAIFHEIIGLDSRGPAAAKIGLKGILDKIKCTATASALAISGDLQLPGNIHTLTDIPGSPGAITGVTGDPVSDSLIGIACNNWAGDKELRDVLAAHEHLSGFGDSCSYSANFANLAASYGLNIDQGFDGLDGTSCQDVIADDIMASGIFPAGTVTLEGGQRSWLTEDDPEDNVCSEDEQSSNSDDEQNQSLPESDDSQSVDNEVENVSNPYGATDVISLLTDSAALAADIAADWTGTAAAVTAATTLAGLSLAVGTSIFIYSVAVSISSAYDDDPNNNFMERKINAHRRLLDRQANKRITTRKAKENHVRSSFTGQDDPGIHTPVETAMCRMAVAENQYRQEIQGNGDYDPVPWASQAEDNFELITGCDYDWSWHTDMSERRHWIENGPYDTRLDIGTFNLHFRQNLCEYIHTESGQSGYCGGIAPEPGDGEIDPSPAPARSRKDFTLKR